MHLSFVGRWTPHFTSMPLASVIWVRVLRVHLGPSALSNIPKSIEFLVNDELYISWTLIHCPELHLYFSSNISHHTEEIRNILLATTSTTTRPCIPPSLRSLLLSLPHFLFFQSMASLTVTREIGNFDYQGQWGQENRIDGKGVFLYLVYVLSYCLISTTNLNMKAA